MGEETGGFPTPAAVIRKTCGALAGEEHLSLKVR